MNDLMTDRLKEIIKQQRSFKTSNLNYLSKKQSYSFINSSLPVMFLRDKDENKYISKWSPRSAKYILLWNKKRKTW